MSLIIEDGSLVINANSYVTVLELRDYASARGVIIPLADADNEVALIKAIDYLESIGNYKGTKVELNQALEWPRVGVIVGMFSVSEIVIPAQIKKAQIQLALHSLDGVDLIPVVTGNFVVREKIGPIETQYSEKLHTTSEPTLPLVDALLSILISPFKSKHGGFGYLPVTRI